MAAEPSAGPFRHCVDDLPARNAPIPCRTCRMHRTFIEKLMRESGLTARHDFIDMVRGLSLTDTF